MVEICPDPFQKTLTGRKCKFFNVSNSSVSAGSLFRTPLGNLHSEDLAKTYYIISSFHYVRFEKMLTLAMTILGW